jgi:hypothetical protein
MGHRLQPRPGQPFLSPDEVVNRLREELPHVCVDREAGSDHVGDMIVQFLRMKEGYQQRKSPPPEAAKLDEHIERLTRSRGDALYASIDGSPADDDAAISFAVVPGEPIIVGYASRRHEDLATPLIEQVARILEYEMRLL